MSTRTNKRSRSGAHVPCPHCGKRVRTEKGLGMNIAEIHFEPDQRARELVEATSSEVSEHG